MSQKLARRMFNRVFPVRLTSYWSLERLERNEEFALLLKNPTRRKIVLHYLRNQNAWSSISSLAASIGESKATVQDHLETMKDAMLVERWFMNRRLFRLKPEIYPELAPNPFVVAGVILAAILATGYAVRPSDVLAGMLAGVSLMLTFYIVIETRRA
ncbi:MAG TPA: hypothetical protein VMS77_08605 [Conexivisphaerales archaeon]|nr:hypothetical protein [Conexivisphaerales archaeon]